MRVVDPHVEALPRKFLSSGRLSCTLSTPSLQQQNMISFTNLSIFLGILFRRKGPSDGCCTVDGWAGRDGYGIHTLHAHPVVVGSKFKSEISNPNHL